MKTSITLPWRQAFSILLLMLGAGKALAESPKLNRAISKEPTYQSKSPKFGLLKFDAAGLELAWLVLDGDTLYVDRNGNGDLTESDEKIAATKDSGVGPEQRGYTFDVGQLSINGRTHLGLTLGFTPLRLYRSNTLGKITSVKAALVADPEALVASIDIDVKSPDRQGGGLGGRLGFTVGGIDLEGPLQFAATPVDTPVIDFAGPMQLTFCMNRPILRVGRSSELYLVLAATGVGPGTLANLKLESIPISAKPLVRLSLPTADGSATPMVQQTLLLNRCCGVNLHGAVRVPDTAGPGTATVELSLDPWQGLGVASTTHSLKVLPERTQLTEPVAANLIASLPHPDERSLVPKVVFSPDGTRLFSTSYPSGVVRIWDVAARKELHRIDTPSGYRHTFWYALLSPDWLTLYVPMETRTVNEFERDGKRVHHFEYSGDIRVWDVSSGREKDPIKSSEGSGVQHAELSPDGRWLWMVEARSYDHTTGTDYEQANQTVLRNLATGESWKLCEGYALPKFSPDGKSVVYVVCDRDEKTSYVKRVELETRKELANVACPKELNGDRLGGLSPDGKLVAVDVTVWNQGEPGKLWFLDAQTLHDRGTMVMPSDSKEYGWVRGEFSPDSQQFIALGSSGEILVWNVAEQKVVRTLPLAADLHRGQMVLTPDGKTLAIISQSKTEDEESTDADEPDPAELPQPHITLYDLTSKTSPRVLVAPHGYTTGGLAISPNGKTLALGGVEAVHLFDLTK